MSDLERESELREFESAARLYSGRMMCDRFTHGSTDGGSNVPERDTVKMGESVRRRVTSEWAPNPIVCKRFNIRPPENVKG